MASSTRRHRVGKKIVPINILPPPTLTVMNMMKVLMMILTSSKTITMINTMTATQTTISVIMMTNLRMDRKLETSATMRMMVTTHNPSEQSQLKMEFELE